MSNKNNSKRKKIIAVIKLALLLMIILGIPAYVYFFHKDFIAEFASPERMESLLEEYKGWGYGIIVFFQALQIVISIIPSQWIQIAGAYAYGFGITAILSIVGTIIGTVIAYYIAKLLGRDALRLFIKEEKIEHFIEKLNSKKAMVFVAVIYFVPGVPKDLCNYAAGISNMNIIMFLVISIVARTPAMMMSILVGNQFSEGDYISVIVISIVMIILFALGAIFRKQVFEFVDYIYNKLTRNGETDDERQARKKVEWEEKRKKLELKVEKIGEKRVKKNK